MKNILFILLLFSSSLNAIAQQYLDDAAIWVNIYLEKKLNKHVDVHLNQQNRFNDNITEHGNSYADLGLTYNFNKHFSLMADYVFIERRKLDNTYSTRHQFYAAFIAKKEWGKWKFIYRNMLQSQVKNVYSSYDGAVPVWYNRNKLTIKYQLNKHFTCYTAQELYLPLYQAQNKGLDRSRTFGGLFYKLTKHTELEGYFLYQHELNAFGPTNRVFVYGIGIEHKF
jgi:hypothetical protein